MPEDLDFQKDVAIDSSNTDTTSDTITTAIGAGGEGDSTAELAAVVDTLLTQLSSKFSNITSELIGKMDDMSRRLDTLESTIQSSASRATSTTAGEGPANDDKEKGIDEEEDDKEEED